MNTLLTIIGKGIWVIVWTIVIAILASFLPLSNKKSIPKENDESLFV